MKKKRKIILLIALLLLLLIGVAVAFILSDKGEELLSKLASSDSFNQGKYIEPDYKVDGELSEEIWESAPCVTYGNPETETDEVTYRFHYGERGVTASFVVMDPTICYAASAYDNAQIFRLSDAVVLYLDVKNDGNLVPQEDDIKVCIAADGRTALARGTGTQWAFTNESVDCQVVVDGVLNEAGGQQDVSWTAEFFIPYELFKIDKEGTMGMMLEWADSNSPSFEATRYYWHNGGEFTTICPEMFHPIDKEGLAFAAPEGWVPSMGRFVSTSENEFVAEDIRALAYYRGAKMENGSGTVEATFDISKTEDFYDVPRFSGILFGIDEVGETEAPGWEVKTHYGLFLNDNEENPQLVLSSIRIQEDGKVQYRQLTGKSILDILPDYLETKVCRVKIAKNQGWMEIYMQDAKGKYQHMFDMFEEEAINGDYIGVRTAVAGFTVRDFKVTTEKPAAVTPYSGPGFKSYGGLVQKLSGEQFWARTPGTMATFGTLENKYKATSLKSITTSLTIPERPSEPEDKLKGILINYNGEEDSYLLLDYRHGEKNVKEWEEDYRFYIRHKGADKWGDVCFVMNAEANTTYDFRITPITTSNGATDVLVEYKKSTETVWQAQYCKRDSWKMTGNEYGIYTQVGDQKFSAFKIVESDYLPLDEARYDSLEGVFIGNKDGGVSSLAKFSTALDKSVNLSQKNSYMITTSFKVVPDKTDSIKAIMFNYDKQDGSRLFLDYRWEEDAYELYIRRHDGKKWAGAWKCGVKLTENAWYDFNIHVVNGKKKTTIIVESKTGDEDYTCISRILNYSMSGREVGYTSTSSSVLQYGKIMVGETNYIGAEDSRYTLREGAFTRTDTGVQTAVKFSTLIDKTINPSKSDNYSMVTAFNIAPDRTDSIKGIILNYNEEDGSYLVLDYRYERDAYRLFIRHFNGKKWGAVWDCKIELKENAQYDFRINVVNQKKSTKVTVGYKTGTDSYRSETHRFDFVMSGRQVGYTSTAVNGIQFGIMIEVQQTQDGIPWPEDWSEALKKHKE